MLKALWIVPLLLLASSAFGQSTLTDRLNGITASVAVKAPVKAVATTNITLEGEQTVGGVAVVEGDRVLVTAQSSAVDNGIYNVSTGDWERAKDFDGNRDAVKGTLVLRPIASGRGAFYQVTSSDPIVIGTSSVNFILLDDPAVSFPQTAAEISAGITPTSTAYPVGDIRRYGVVGTCSASDATANSTAIQKAVDVASEAGGGDVYFPAGTWCTNAPIIVPNQVGLHGDGRYASIVKKTTNTASSIAESTTPRYGGAITNPAAVFHLVLSDGGLFNYSGATVRDLTASGDVTNPNNSLVTYCFFFHGVTNATIKDTRATGCKVGYYFGNGANITSEISGNRAEDVQRGFYIESGTSLSYHHNYVNRYRYRAHDLSAYYSVFSSNAADNGGYASYRIANTEVALAYKFHSSNGSTAESNGAETHNGPLWELSSNTSFTFRNNIALDVTSNHDNVGSGLSIYALYIDSNIDLTMEDNKVVFATTKLSGSAQSGSHYNWGVGTSFGDTIFNRNHFVDTVNGTSDSGWTNTSGTLTEVEGSVVLSASYTGTLTGGATSPTGTIEYDRVGNMVTLALPTITATSNTTAATITGMPAAIRPSATRTVLIRVSENSATVLGLAEIGTNGTITLYSSVSAAAFTASGTKGVNASVIHYPL